MSDAILKAIQEGVQIFDLGRTMFTGMPQSPNHPQFLHVLPRRHGDSYRSGNDSAANDLVVTGTHVGTHIDALAHVSHKDCLHDGVPVSDAMDHGRFVEYGAHTIEPMVCRAVLLDVPAYLKLESCVPGYEITPNDLEGCADDEQVEVRPGDVVLIRSGWGQQFDNGTEAYLGKESGVPGVSEAGARWLLDHRVHAAGADTIAFEQLAPGRGHGSLPAHRVLLVEGGVYIIEALDLEALAKARVYEFLFVLAPLKLFGATGSPVRPLAVISR